MSKKEFIDRDKNRYEVLIEISRYPFFDLLVRNEVNKMVFIFSKADYRSGYVCERKTLGILNKEQLFFAKKDFAYL